MEQLTPQEWASEQLKRAPSFTIAFGLLGIFLFISTFIQYSSARPESDIPPVEADIAMEEPPQIEEIKEKLIEEPPEFKPIDAPLVTDEEVSQVDAPIEDRELDIEFTEDVASENDTPTDPFPMELTKKMAVIGTEAGSGGFRGSLGSRSGGGRRAARAKYGVPAKADDAILSGLRWLKSVQEPDGSWSAGKWEGQETVSTHQGVTGLALLAFLGHGCTDREPQEFAGTVRKALDYMMNTQAPDGSFGVQGSNDRIGRMYAHGICTLAMCEAYGMMQNPKFKEVAEKALQFTYANQNANGGFGYDGSADLRQEAPEYYGTTDLSVAAFQFQGIKAAKTAELTVPPEVIEKVESYLQVCVNPDFSSSYRPGRTASSFSMTAASLAMRLLWWGGASEAPNAEGQAKYLTANVKDLLDVAKGNRAGHMWWSGGGGRSYDLYSIYYTSLAMFHMGGNYWKVWKNEYYGPILYKQVKGSGPDRGSWAPDKVSHGETGGRVYSTALAVLSLEAYCRYERE